MQRYIILFLCLVLPVINLHPQISEGGMPYSATIAGLKSTSAIPKFSLKSINIEQLLAEDQLNPRPYRYAIFEDTIINIKASGKVDVIPGKGKIWRLRIASEQAKSIQIIFKRFILPSGALVFIYNENQSMMKGAFTQKNMQHDSTLVLADFQGNHMIIEYFEPDNPGIKSEIVIGSISQAYRDVFAVKSSDGYININCPEGKNDQLDKHAVARITFKSEESSYLCSGALINNVRSDGTPYFLTAHHCINKSDEASSMVAYFNYENAGCDGAETVPLTITGASLLSTADSSDYSLLLLNNLPPNTAQPYYAGWNVNDLPAKYVTGIHHPLGLTKKLCIDYDSIYPNPVDLHWQESSVSPVGSHWVVGFDIGITNGGSSGSPLFNNKKQIIGQLHGGSDNFDIYGKLSFSWAYKPVGYPSLLKFLDPDSTGTLELNGYYPATNPPDAFFTWPTYRTCLNSPVMLQDYSVFEPYVRNWTITPATFTYVDGTSETSPKPIIKFLNPGFYSISLGVTNTSGSDSMQTADAILAGDTIEVSLITNPDGEICECDFKQIQLSASGATTYNWNILPGDVEKVELNSLTGDTVMISPFPGFNPDGGYSFNIMTIGKQGTCSDTLLTTFQVLEPANDDIKNAILLSYGKSILYNNICASLESGEPVPPFTSCTSQLSWCDEYGTGLNIVENSVWFKFIAPVSGLVRVWSTGMDNELALYEADSETDILNGDYVLLGANDDRTETDYNPNIRSADVIPGKTYWIQEDGSGGGTQGEFYIHLYELSPSGTNDLQENKLLVYPQPASQFVYLKGDELLKYPSIFLEVFNTSGVLVHRENLCVNQGTIMMDISAWESGVYLARINTGETVYTARILKF